MIKTAYTLLLLLFLSCTETSQPKLTTKYVEIRGRQASSLHQRPVYRLKIPYEWEINEISSPASLSDTTQAIAEFFLREKGQQLRMTIHNFPSESLQERIPPTMQVMRWKKQFTYLEPTTVHLLPQAFSGFVGLLFEGRGLLKGQSMSVMAWIMQLAPEHYTSLTYTTQFPGWQIKQMCADVSIKAVGPSEMVERHHQAIISIARSFELIEEIPSPL